MAVGRISGPLLKSNLVRNGIDLAFETNLLYLDVNNARLGVKTSSPQYELDVNGTTKTTNLVANNIYNPITYTLPSVNNILFNSILNNNYITRIEGTIEKISVTSNFVIVPYYNESTFVKTGTWYNITNKFYRKFFHYICYLPP